MLFIFQNLPCAFIAFLSGVLKKPYQVDSVLQIDPKASFERFCSLLRSQLTLAVRKGFHKQDKKRLVVFSPLWINEVQMSLGSG